MKFLIVLKLWFVIDTRWLHFIINFKMKLPWLMVIEIYAFYFIICQICFRLLCSVNPIFQLQFYFNLIIKYFFSFLTIQGWRFFVIICVVMKNTFKNIFNMYQLFFPNYIVRFPSQIIQSRALLSISSKII